MASTFRALPMKNGFAWSVIFSLHCLVGVCFGLITHDGTHYSQLCTTMTVRPFIVVLISRDSARSTPRSFWSRLLRCQRTQQRERIKLHHMSRYQSHVLCVICQTATDAKFTLAAEQVRVLWAL